MSNYTIETNKNVALVKLNQTWQTPDKINIIKYYTESGGIDFILAIGKASGFGPDYYSIVQAHEEVLVVNIGNRLTDVSQLIHSEKVLCYCDPYNTSIDKWYMITDEQGQDNIWIRHFTELIEPAIYRNLDDGFRWFFVNGVLKREDDFLDSEQTTNLVEQNIEYFQAPRIEFNFDFPEGTEHDGYSYYLPELDPAVIEKPKFSVQIFNYKNEDVTNKYTISLDGPEHIDYITAEGKYMIWGRWEQDFILKIQATRNSFTTTAEVKVWFPEITYYGKCIVSDVDNSIVPRGLKAKYIYHDLEKLDLEFTLDNERSILIIPQGFEQFSHVYDRNGLDYIQNYTYYPNYEYLGVMYQAYLKIEPIVINNLQQRFTYTTEYIDLPNSGWLRELDKEDYYTKEQVDQLLSNIPTLILDGNKLTIGDRSFRLEPWIDIADYYIGMFGGTRESFYSKTVDQLVSDATPYMVVSTPSFAHEYTNDEAGLVIFYIILKFNVQIESGNLRSGGNIVTEFTAEDFNDPTYFDVRYGTVAINGASYNVIGVRGVSLPDPDNMITLNFIKH